MPGSTLTDSKVKCYKAFLGRVLCVAQQVKLLLVQAALVATMTSEPLLLASPTLLPLPSILCKAIPVASDLCPTTSVNLRLVSHQAT